MLFVLQLHHSESANQLINKGKELFDKAKEKFKNKRNYEIKKFTL
jgi:hypothetical protein